MCDKKKLNGIKNIVFVCTGNTCRSPMAEALMKKLLKDNNIDTINVISRGLSAFENSPASENSIKAIKKYNIDLTSHRAKSLSPDELKYYDLILTMSSNHKNIIISAFPDVKDKIFTVYEFSFNKNADISDPFGGNIEIYEKCLDEIYKCIEEIVKKQIII